MKQLHIITPVKDSIELTLQTIESILSSDFTVPFIIIMYIMISVRMKIRHVFVKPLRRWASNC